MNRTHLAAAVAVLALVLLLAAGTRPEAPSGRYQIISARALLMGMTDEGPATQEIPIVLRIDTATGDTWRLLLLNNRGKSSETWRPITGTTATNTP